LYNSLSPQTVSVDTEPKFQTPTPPSQILAPAPAIQNVCSSRMRLRLYSPAAYQVGSFIIARVAGQFIVHLKFISKWELSIELDFKSNLRHKSIASNTFRPI